MKRIAVLLATLAIAVFGWGGIDPWAPIPATQPAATQESMTWQTAKSRERQAEENALNAYRKSLIVAREALVKELEAAQQTVSGEGGVGDAEALNMQLNDARQELNAIRSGWTATILGTDEWRHVVTVPRGKYRVSATGAWSDNPHAPLIDPNGYKNTPGLTVANEGALLVRVNGNFDVIGSGKVIECSNEQNYIEMEMSDSDHSDNRGSVNVVVNEEQ